MARTLSSSHSTAEPTPSQPSAQQQALDMVWSIVIELWKVGFRYGKLNRAIPRLGEQLIRPKAGRRDGFIEACIRHDTWKTERQALGMLAPPLLSNLTTHFGKLSQKQRLALIANEGWAQTTDPKMLAEGMWEMFTAEGARWPKGEPNFSKTELSDWLDAQMAEERQQIVDAVTARYWAMQRREAA